MDVLFLFATLLELVLSQDVQILQLQIMTNMHLLMMDHVHGIVTHLQFRSIVFQMSVDVTVIETVS